MIHGFSHSASKSAEDILDAVKIEKQGYKKCYEAYHNADDKRACFSALQELEGDDEEYRHKQDVEPVGPMEVKECLFCKRYEIRKTF